MNIQLIDEEVKPREALELVTRLIHLKINYYQDKMNAQPSGPKLRETEQKIKQLQKELFLLKKTLDKKTGPLKLDAIIRIE